MKNIKKLLATMLVVVMCLAMVFAVVACDPNTPDNPDNPDNPTPDDPTPTPDDPTDGYKYGEFAITMWVSESDGVAELTRQQVAAFNASQSNFKIVLTAVEGVSEAESATQVISDVESAPDIYCFAQDQTSRLVQAGALAQPGDAATATIKASHDAGAIKAATVGDTVVAYPLTSDNGYFMFYDKRYIKESSLDSLELLLADCVAAEKNFSMELDTSAWYLASFFFAVGCHSDWTMDEKGKAVKISDNWNSDQGIIAMKGIQILEHSDNYVSSSSTQDFGKAIPSAVVVSGTWGIENAKKAIGEENLGYTDLPSFTVDGKTYHLGSYSGNKLMGVKPQTDKTRAAALQALALYLTNAECQVQRFETVGWGPSNLEAQANEAVQADPALAALALQNNYATPQGTIDGGWWDLAKVLGTDAKEAVLGDETALKAGLEKYDAGLQAIVNKSDNEASVWSVIGAIYGDTWSKDHDLTEKPAGTFTSAPIYFEAGNEFKVRQGHAWTNDTGAVSDNPGNCEQSAKSGNCSITVTGLYQVKYDGTSKKISVVEASFGLVGKINGTDDWNTDIAMTKVDGEVAYITAVITLAAGDEVKVRANGDWDFSWGNDDGGNFAVTTAGSYQVKLSLSADTLTWVVSLVPAE